MRTLNCSLFILVTLLAARPAAAAIFANVTLGSAVSGVNYVDYPIATFLDTDRSQLPSHYEAVILWGDGSQSFGTVNGMGGAFTVLGTNSFVEGNYALTLEIYVANSLVATASRPITVFDNGTLSAPASGTNAVALLGVPFTGTLATFGQTGTIDGTDLKAIINWGDGTQSPGVVGGVLVPCPPNILCAGGFPVSGTHTYAALGSFSLSVTLSHEDGTTSATANSFISVGQLSASPITFVGKEGVAFSGKVAQLIATNHPVQASDLNITIDWGDGTAITTNTAVGPDNAVFGAHLYADEGVYKVTVNVFDATTGVLLASTTGVDTILDADQLAAIGDNITVTAGVPFFGEVASFTYGNPAQSPSDISATIDWGDGATSAASAVVGGAGLFQVFGTHTFANPGTFPLKVTLLDDAPGTGLTVTGIANVGNASGVNVTVIPITPVEGVAFTGTVAALAVNNAALSAGDLAATIDWGDGTSTAATLSGQNGAFTAQGTHTYADEGVFKLTVSVVDKLLAPLATGSGSATVGDGTLAVAAVAPLCLSPCAEFSGVVARVTDANTQASATDLKATIAWGDGSASTGRVEASTTGGFDISGSHGYSAAACFVITVTITDDGGGMVTVTDPVVVSDDTTACACPPHATTSRHCSTSAANIRHSEATKDAAVRTFTAAGCQVAVGGQAADGALWALCLFALLLTRALRRRAGHLLARARTFHFILIAAVAGGCTGSSDHLVGEARATISQVPPGVACVQITASDPNHFVQRNFDVIAGQSSVLDLKGLPIGVVTFSGAAFASACSSIADTEATWLSDATPANLSAGQVATLTLILHKSAAAEVTVTFQDDAGTPPNDLATVTNLSVNPTSIDFGTPTLSPQLRKQLTITNLTTMPIPLYISFQPGPFHLEPDPMYINNCPIDGTLAPMAACTMTILFLTGVDGDYTSALTIDGYLTVPIKGRHAT